MANALEVIGKRQGGDVYVCEYKPDGEEPLSEQGALTEILRDRSKRNKPFAFENDEDVPSEAIRSFEYSGQRKHRPVPTSGFKVAFEWTGLAWDRDEALDIALKCLEAHDGCMLRVEDLSKAPAERPIDTQIQEYFAVQTAPAL